VAFGAHPDDVEFGCGGVIVAETRRGRAAHLVVCSRGEAGSYGTPQQRTREAERAAALLGATVEFLELDGDAHLERRARHAIALAGVLRRVRPGVVLAPSNVDNQHPDHGQLGQLVRDAARLARYGGVAELRELRPYAIGNLFFYAVTAEAEPRDLTPVLFDVSAPEVLATWVAAMEAHASQVRAKPYIQMQLLRAQLRGLQAGVGHAIALYPNEALIVDSLAQLSRGSREF
jgi:LmbE family N-acetylglucosaminyl deacetylase